MHLFCCTAGAAWGENTLWLVANKQLFISPLDILASADVIRLLGIQVVIPEWRRFVLRC